MNEIIISLCDFSGRMIEPWSKSYECFIIDLQHPKGLTKEGNVSKIGVDITECISKWLPVNRKIKFAAAFPPCTHTAVSGARHFLAKGSAGAAEAFKIIARCEQLLKWFGAPYLWEQPVATTSTYCGQPDFIFDPCDYAGYLEDPSLEAYSKRTCLWTGNGFVMPDKKSIEPVKVCAQGSWIQKLGGKSERTKNLRSATPTGFAKAVYLANRGVNEF